MRSLDQLIELLRDFIRRELMPLEAQIDETDEIPARIISQAKEIGLYGYECAAWPNTAAWGFRSVSRCG